MKELQLTIESLAALDNSYDFIMIFLSQPAKHFELVDTTLRNTISKLFDTSKPINDMYTRYNQAINLLNDKWWDHPYPLHDSHFHKSFEAFCNCPYTSLTEIVDVMTKVLHGRLQ
jgi:hypothetical protein